MKRLCLLLPVLNESSIGPAFRLLDLRFVLGR